MKDWKKYFEPRRYVNPYEEAKIEIESICATSRYGPRHDHSDRDIRYAIERMSSMLEPGRIFVLAHNAREAKDFERCLGQKVYIVSNPNALRGLERVHFIFVGRWRMNPHYMEILHILETRRMIDKWNIYDWGI